MSGEYAGDCTKKMGGLVHEVEKKLNKKLEVKELPDKEGKKVGEDVAKDGASAGKVEEGKEAEMKKMSFSDKVDCKLEKMKKCAEGKEAEEKKD